MSRTLRIGSICEPANIAMLVIRIPSRLWLSACHERSIDLRPPAFFLLCEGETAQLLQIQGDVADLAPNVLTSSQICGQRLSAADHRRDRLSADEPRAGQLVLPGSCAALRTRLDDPHFQSHLRQLGLGLSPATACSPWRCSIVTSTTRSSSASTARASDSRTSARPVYLARPRSIRQSGDG